MKSIVDQQDPIAFLKSVLTGGLPAWPRDAAASWRDGLWSAGAYHGVLPLVWHCMRTSPGCDWPQDFLDQLDRFVRTEAAMELARKAELCRVLDLLGRHGVRPLLLKGSALAYSIYSAPFLRPRGDTDLLVGEDSRAIVVRTLQSAGYVQPNQISGSLVSTQSSFHRKDASGIVHAFDVHWRCSNSPLLSSTIDYVIALERSVPVAKLGRFALGLRSEDALLYACIHRASHMHVPFYVDDAAHYGGDRLIWLYDIYLLCRALADRGWNEFADLATRKRVRAICLDGIIAARSALSAVIPKPAMQQLTTGAFEPSAVLLQGGRGAVAWQEFKSLPSWALRSQFIREHLLPDSLYMLRKYGRESRWWLPWLYLRRVVAGFRKSTERH